MSQPDPPKIPNEDALAAKKRRQASIAEVARRSVIGQFLVAARPQSETKKRK